MWFTSVWQLRPVNTSWYLLLGQINQPHFDMLSTHNEESSQELHIWTTTLNTKAISALADLGHFIGKIKFITSQQLSLIMQTNSYTKKDTSKPF